jgi:hypothetical protein
MKHMQRTDDVPAGQQCFCGCGHEATAWTLWGRSY